MVDNKGVPVVCCGQKMTELVPNTAEASIEKHLPIVSSMNGSIMTVNVGSVSHPMEDAHHISFVYVETENGGQRKCLKPGTTPTLTFSFSGDRPLAVFAYCNLHGLWKTEIL